VTCEYNYGYEDANRRFHSSAGQQLCYDGDPEYIEDEPVALKSVIVATNPFSVRIRDRIENAGFNFYSSIMLLPHWLAIEMNWDFAISPQFG